MTIMNYNKIIALGAISTALFSACSDLDLHYQGGTVDEEQLSETIEAVPSRVNSSISGMYAILNTPYSFFGALDGRADDFGYPCVAMGQDMNSADMVNPVSDYDWFSPALEWSDRTPTYANPQIRLGLFYKTIYAANDALSSMPDGEIQNAELRAKRGQARAMRAWSYLSLAPYFQFKYVGHEDSLSVPLVLGGSEEDPRNNPRVPLRALYNQMMIDIDGAIEDLEGFNRASKDVIDVNVAYGIRARIHLNKEEWAEAAADAESALAGYEPYTLAEIQSKTPGFYNASDHNWIWALLLPKEIVGEELGSWPSQLGSFSGNAYAPYAGIYRSINKLLYDKIPADDVRKDWWLNEDTMSVYLKDLSWTDEQKSITYLDKSVATCKIADVKEPMYPYANVKFGQLDGIGSPYNHGDWCMMRAEEMIFIMAEATAKAGNLGKGKQILEDFVKNNRQPSYSVTASDLESFSNEVWKQRRIELWGEGFAMFDVMRLGKPVVRFIEGKETNVPEMYQFNIDSNDPWMLLRFVTKEMTNNAAMVNNEGGQQPKQGDGKELRDGVTD